VADIVSPGLTLAFVDPEPVFPMLTAIPEVQMTPEPEEPWPFSRETQWRPLFGPLTLRQFESSAVPGAVAPVPEMGTLALMLGGLGVVGFWARRKA
jgi:hypothetical protein